MYQVSQQLSLASVASMRDEAQNDDAPRFVFLASDPDSFVFAQGDTTTTYQAVTLSTIHDTQGNALHHVVEGVSQHDTIEAALLACVARSLCDTFSGENEALVALGEQLETYA